MAKNTYQDKAGRVPPTAAPGFNTRDGHAALRADKWDNTDQRAIGWLNGSPVAKLDPQGGQPIEYGPSSKLWNRQGSDPSTKSKG
jgi:hypothetical protein